MSLATSFGDVSFFWMSPYKATLHASAVCCVLVTTLLRWDSFAMSTRDRPPSLASKVQPFLGLGDGGTPLAQWDPFHVLVFTPLRSGYVLVP